MDVLCGPKGAAHLAYLGMFPTHVHGHEDGYFAMAALTPRDRDQT